jgi:hypothetical protein
MPQDRHGKNTPPLEKIQGICPERGPIAQRWGWRQKGEGEDGRAKRERAMGMACGPPQRD